MYALPQFFCNFLFFCNLSCDVTTEGIKYLMRRCACHKFSNVRERVCCLLVLNSVTSTPQWIRQPEAAWGSSNVIALDSARVHLTCEDALKVYRELFEKACLPQTLKSHACILLLKSQSPSAIALESTIKSTCTHCFCFFYTQCTSP